MAVDILVPPLSQTMDTLVLVEWTKKIGEPVTKGEILFRVETDKATLDVEAPASGVLQETLAQPGDEIRIRGRIGSIAEAGEPVAPGAAAVPAQIQISRETGPAADATGPFGEPLPPGRQNRIFASPRARQFARRHGIAVETLQGTGTGPQNLIVEQDVISYLDRVKEKPRATPLAQRMADAAGLDLSSLAPAQQGVPITKADVEAILQVREKAAAEIGPSKTRDLQPSPAESRRVELTPIRRTIARRMLESQASAAPVTYMSEVDATRLVKLRERILSRLPDGAPRPTYTDFLVRMLCQVLPRHPELNATFDGETLELYEAVHMALAVDTARGLLVPVIRDAQEQGVIALAGARARLVERAVQGTITPEELRGGTFTLSNLGPLGIDHFTPIINPPQTAILGAGRIRQAPAVHKGKLRIRHLIGLALTCDHRIIDGAPAARFLGDVGNLIENPDLIWL